MTARNAVVGSREVSFVSPHSYGAIRKRLDTIQPGEWCEGESYYYGDYLARSWSHGRESGWIRLYFVDGAKYCKLRLWTETECTEASLQSWCLMQEFVQQELLPALDGSGVHNSSEID